MLYVSKWIPYINIQMCCILTTFHQHSCTFLLSLCLFSRPTSFSCLSLTTTRWTGVLPWPATGCLWSLWSCWSASSILLAHTGRWASTQTPLPQLHSVFPTTMAGPWWTWSCCYQSWCSSACTWCTEPSCCTAKCCWAPPTGASARSTTSTSPFALYSRYWWTNTQRAPCWPSSSSSGSLLPGCLLCVRGREENCICAKVQVYKIYSQIRDTCINPGDCLLKWWGASIKHCFK